MEESPSDKHFDIIESGAVSEPTVEETVAIEQPDTKPESRKAKRALRALGQGALAVGAYSGTTAGLYLAMRSGSLDSLHVPLIQSGDSGQQLQAALELSALVTGTIAPATAKFVRNRRKK